MHAGRLARREERRARTANQRYAAGYDVVRRRIVDLQGDVGAGQWIVDRDVRPGITEQIADQPAEQDSDKTDDRGLNDEYLPHPMFAHAERLHDRDVLALLMGDRGDDVVGGKGGGQKHRAHHGQHDEIAHRECRKQVGVGLLPGHRFVAGLRLHLARDLLCDQGIVQPQPQFVDDAALPHHRLREAGEGIDLSLVDALQSGAEHTDHRRGHLGALAADQHDGSAALDRKLLGQRLTDDDGVRRTAEVGDLSLTHLGSELGDAGLQSGIDAGQRHADTAAAVIDDRGGPDRGRHVAGQPRAQRRHHRLRIFDAGAVVQIGDVRHLDRAIFLIGGLCRHGAALVLDGDVRHGIDQLPQEIDLRALHQARHHDGEADAHRDTRHADQRLPDAGRDVGPCDVIQKPGRHAFQRASMTTRGQRDRPLNPRDANGAVGSG